MKPLRHKSLLAAALMLATFQAEADPSLQDLIRGKCPSAANYLDKLDAQHASAGNVRPDTPSDPDAAAEFTRRATADEAARNAIRKQLPHPSQASIEKVTAVDTENQAYLKQFIREHGVPNSKIVGNDGLRGAWLITQHADKDPDLQRLVLAGLKATSATAAVSMDEVAMLDDRIHVSEGLPQAYGSQMSNSDGVLKPREPVDRVGIDERRLKAGLMPLNDYVCMMNALPH